MTDWRRSAGKMCGRDFVSDASPQRQRQRETTAEQRSLRTLEDGKPTGRRRLPYRGDFRERPVWRHCWGCRVWGCNPPLASKWLDDKQLEAGCSHRGPPAPLPHPIPHTLHTAHAPFSSEKPQSEPLQVLRPTVEPGPPAVEGVPWKMSPTTEVGLGGGRGRSFLPETCQDAPSQDAVPKGGWSWADAPGSASLSPFQL